MGARRSVAVIVLIGTLVGCRPTPAGSQSPPASGTQSPASVATEPSLSPTTLPSAAPPSGISTALGDTWTRLELPGERPEPIAAVNGDSGVVVVGRQCIKGSEGRCVMTASAWRTDDNGGTWQLAPVEDGEGAFMKEAIYNGSYFALGQRIERRGEARHTFGILWRSADGADWQRFSSLDLGECTEEGCPSAIGLDANQDGPFMLERVLSNPSGQGPPYRSDDGVTWEPIPPAEFGLEHGYDVVVADATPTSPGFLALLTGRHLPMTAWFSDDARSWTPAGAFDDTTGTSASIAIGSEVVVARTSCKDLECETTMWLRPLEGGAFEPTGATFPMRDPRVTYTGPTGYLLVGLEEGGPRAYTSLDGRTWTVRAPGPPRDACGAGWLAGGPSLAVYLGELGCGGAWLTRGSGVE